MSAAKIRRFVLLSVLSLMAWIGLILIDPLGSYTFVSSKTSTIFAQARAPFYGDGSARQNITVVLLTDEAAKDFPTYPLSPDDYASILADIVQHDPLAVFVDIGFDDLHRKQENFVDQMLSSLNDATAGQRPAATAKPTIPLVFAVDGLTPASSQIAISDDTDRRLRDRFRIYQVPVRQQNSDPGVYQLRFPETQANGTGVDRSAAFLLYSLACPRLGPAIAESAEGCPRNTSHDFDDNLALQWGVEPSDSDKERADCLRGGQSWFDHLRLSGSFLALGGLPGLFGQNALAQNCHYSEWMVTSDLGRPSAAAEVEAKIRGRIVLLGIYDGVKDMHATPFDPVGGVFVHAMALDNLLTYGSTYFRELGPIVHGSTWTWTRDRLYTLVAWSLISLPFSLLLTFWPKKPRTAFGRFIGVICGNEEPDGRSSTFRAALHFLTDIFIAACLVAVAVYLSLSLRVRLSSVLSFTVLTPVLFKISRRLNKWLEPDPGEKDCPDENFPVLAHRDDVDGRPGPAPG